MNGVITTFFADKGYGFIQGENNTSYFFHVRDLEKDTNQLDISRGYNVSFSPSKGQKGEQAKNVTTNNKLNNVSKQTYNNGECFKVPDDIWYSRESSIAGWEILSDSGWYVIGSTNSPGQAPDDAKQEMFRKALAIGANAVISAKYTKTTGEDGNYRYSLHHHSGRAVIIGKRSAEGSPLNMILTDMNKAASELYGKAEKKKKSRGITILVTLLLITILFMTIGINSDSSIFLGIVYVIALMAGYRIYNNCCHYILSGYKKV